MFIKFKKVISIILTFVLVLSMCSINAITDVVAAKEGTTNYYVTGSEKLVGVEWQPMSEQGKMTLQEDGTYSITFKDIPAGDYPWKVTDGTWSNTYGENGKKAEGEPNEMVYTNEVSDITFTFDPKTGVALASSKTIQYTYAVAGVIDLIGANWDPSAPEGQMTETSDNVWQITFEDIFFGEYAFKIVQGTNWGTEWGDTSSVDGSAYAIVKEDGTDVTITFYSDVEQFVVTYNDEVPIKPETPTDPEEEPTTEPTTAEPTTAEPTTAEPTTVSETATINGQEAKIGDKIIYTLNLQSPDDILGLEFSVAYTDSVLGYDENFIQDFEQNHNIYMPTLYNTTSTGLKHTNFYPYDGETAFYANYATIEESAALNFSEKDTQLVKLVFTVKSSGTANIVPNITNILKYNEDNIFVYANYTITDSVVIGEEPTEPTTVEPTTVEPTTVEPTTVEPTTVSETATINGQEAKVGDKIIYTLNLQSFDNIVGLNFNVEYTGDILEYDEDFIEDFEQNQEKYIPLRSNETATGLWIIKPYPFGGETAFNANYATIEESEALDFSETNTQLVQLIFTVKSTGTANITPNILDAMMFDPSYIFPNAHYTISDSLSIVEGNITEPTTAEPTTEPSRGVEWLTVDGIEGGKIEFDFSTGTITSSETSVTSANIPSEIDGVSVKAIEKNAFYDCSSLTEVTIPDSITSIGESAFDGCHNLTLYISVNNTYAINYAEDNNISYMLTGDIPEITPTVDGNAKEELNPQLTVEHTESMFTAEELTSGEALSLNLVVNEIETVSQDEQKAIDIAIEEFEKTLDDKSIVVGEYLDIDLYKQVGETSTALTQLDEEITITFDIPQDMLKENTNYYMLRIHNGVAEILEDLDTNPNTITIKTDKFSTYVIAFDEEKTNSANGDVNLDGTVNLLDAILISSYLAKLDNYDMFILENADVNLDGEVTTEDSLKIQKYLVELIEIL